MVVDYVAIRTIRNGQFCTSASANWREIAIARIDRLAGVIEELRTNLPTFVPRTGPLKLDSRQLSDFRELVR